VPQDDLESSVGVSDEPPVERVRPAIVIQAEPGRIVLFEPGTNTPVALTDEVFSERYAGIAFQLAKVAEAPNDPDAGRATRKTFGFRWFIPELLKHRKVWRDVLIASLVIQLLALATPLFTQVIIDKVIVHRTQDTLIVIGIALLVVTLFSSLLSWVRQYLVLHTGNRVDAVLGAAVFEHLFRLPPRYFEHRPTGVITSRLRGVENIREFVSSAAVTLILDLPVPTGFCRDHARLQCALDGGYTGHHCRHCHTQPDYGAHLSRQT
jgi:subfamily B ATP-binding cassette protein HlyB/CyaB